MQLFLDGPKVMPTIEEIREAGVSSTFAAEVADCTIHLRHAWIVDGETKAGMASQAPA